MPPKTSRVQIDEATKNQFIGAVVTGKSVRQAGRKYGIHKSTAQDIWTKWKKTESTENLPCSGRPKKTMERMERSIIRELLTNRRKPFREIANRKIPKMSTSTVRNVLARKGYHRRVAKKVPYLTRAHKRARLAWARICKAYAGLRIWRKKIWSDECYVYLGDNRGRIFVTRRPGEELHDNCCVPKFAQSSVRVMVWACIMKGRKGPLVVLEYPGGRGGGMNSARYQEQVLDGVLKDFYHQVSKEESGIEFQQDGAASHRSKSTMKWFHQNQIPLFYHPSCSPDLSPIEPVWLELKKRLRALPYLPTTVPQLIQVVKDIWDKLPISDIDKHIDTMDKRVKAVFAAKGGHTPF